MDDFIHQNQPQFERICQKMQTLLTRRQKLAAEEPKEIVDGVYLGNYSYAIDKQYIEQHGISLVVSCLKIEQRDRLPGVHYEFVLVNDKPEENISQHFDQFCKLVSSHLSANDQHRCLVNCFFAKSRSPTLVASYLIKQKSMDVQAALSLLKEKSGKVDPNKGFISQLQQYSKTQSQAKSQQENNLKIEQVAKHKTQQVNQKQPLMVKSSDELKHEGVQQIEKITAYDESKPSESNENTKEERICQQISQQAQIKPEAEHQQKTNETTIPEVSVQSIVNESIENQSTNNQQNQQTIIQTEHHEQETFQNLQKAQTESSEKKEDQQVPAKEAGDKQSVKQEKEEEAVGHEEGEIRKKKKKHKKKKG